MMDESLQNFDKRFWNYHTFIPQANGTMYAMPIPDPNITPYVKMTKAGDTSIVNDVMNVPVLRWSIRKMPVIKVEH
jgi:hypothetical protein